MAWAGDGNEFARAWLRIPPEISAGLAERLVAEKCSPEIWRAEITGWSDGLRDKARDSRGLGLAAGVGRGLVGDLGWSCARAWLRSGLEWRA